MEFKWAKNYPSIQISKDPRPVRGKTRLHKMFCPKLVQLCFLAHHVSMMSSPLNLFGAHPPPTISLWPTHWAWQRLVADSTTLGKWLQAKHRQNQKEKCSICMFDWLLRSREQFKGSFQSAMSQSSHHAHYLSERGKRICISGIFWKNATDTF